MYFITICTKEKKHILGEIPVGAPAHGCPVNHINHPNTRLVIHINRPNTYPDINMCCKINLSENGKIVKQYIENINDIYEHAKLNIYTIMPNHIHMIANISTGHLWAGAPTITIPKIINSLKTITSKKIGYPIWQRNYHEHIIRNENEYYRIAEYIQNNPYNWEKDNLYK